MANLLGNEQKQTSVNIFPSDKHEESYNRARSNLLLVLVFTVINLILLVSNSNTYFVFTASVPYIVLDMGLYLCGKYPAEVYEGGVNEYAFLGDGVFIFFISIVVLVVLLYLISWLFSSKRRVGWLIFATVLFSVDTAAMFWWYGFSVDMLLDIVFHAWIIVSLIFGIRAHYKLRNITVDEEKPIDCEITEANESVKENDLN